MNTVLALPTMYTFAAGSGRHIDMNDNGNNATDYAKSSYPLRTPVYA